MAMDLGMALDAYFIPVQKMAFSKEQHLLVTGFLTFHFGKRLTNYE